MILLFFLIEVIFSFSLDKGNGDVILKETSWSLNDVLDLLRFKDNADCNWLTSFMCDK